MLAVSPQTHRTFFVTTITRGRRSQFQVERNVLLLLDVFRSDRQKGSYLLHAFVVMPDHLHLLLTPAPSISLEKSMQYIKGGFSFRLQCKGEFWQRSFTDHRIVNSKDYRNHLLYIVDNPGRAGLSASRELYPYSSVSRQAEVDPAPEHLQE
jgi:putative transposase